MQVQKTHQRKKNSILNKFINWLNSKPVGYVYTCKEVRDNNYEILPERLGYMHGFLKYAKCIKRVGRGQYQILGFIPDFVTWDLLEGTMGYRIYRPQSNTFVPRGAKWFMGDPNPYLNEEPIVEVKPEVKTLPEPPVKRFTTAELISKQNYIIAFIADTERKIGAPGGWIAREANWDNIALAKKDLEIIKVELAFRKNQKPLNRENVLEILRQGLSHQDTATAIMNLSLGI